MTSIPALWPWAAKLNRQRIFLSNSDLLQAEPARRSAHVPEPITIHLQQGNNYCIKRFFLFTK